MMRLMNFLKKKAKGGRTIKMFLVKCPKCGHSMKYQSSSQILAGKRKQCVYCGHSIKVSEHVVGKLEK